MTTFTVAKDDAGSRIDRILAARPDVISRSAAQRLIAEDRVRVNEAACSKHYVAREGDVVAYEIPPPRDSRALPEAIDVDVVHEDDDLIVVSKPAGLVVHPAHGHHAGTLVNALLHRCHDLSGIGGEQRPGIVHRLDKDTSGLLIVAKNDAAHVELSRQLKHKLIKRIYVALVQGSVPMDEGVIDAPIGRSARDRKKMAVVAGARAARTHFRVLERMTGHTLIELSLETGRTHQIRVHLAHIGHPVVGDSQYGSANSGRKLGLGRQFLHATSLTFHRPSTGEVVTVSDRMPQDLDAALERARRN